jgi:hypothetical protein
LVLTDRRFLGKSHNYFSTWKDGSTSELIMTFGDSLLQALGTGLCERSVPPIHSRRSRLCGPAAHSRALVRSLRNSGKCLRNCFLLTDWIFSARLSAERAQRISQSFLRLEDSRATRPAETVGGSYCFLPAERLRRNYADRAVIFRHKEKTEIAGARGLTVRKSRSVYSGRIPTTVNTWAINLGKKCIKKPCRSASKTTRQYMRSRQ